jgi:hypothetical protein
MYCYEYSEVTRNPNTNLVKYPGDSPKRQVVPLITLLYLIMFLLITLACSG